MDSIKIGKSIALLRKKMNMTQKQLADKVGVSYQAVSKWENGLSIPDISVISKIAMLLDIDVESLLEGNLTQHENNWVGVLFLDYPEGINSDTLLYTQPLVEFQIALLLLAGIKNIYLVGEKSEPGNIKSILENRSLGVNFHYIDTNKSQNNHTFMSKLPNIFTEAKFSNHGAIIINRPSFLYGKDVSRIFNRIMNDEKTPVNIQNFDNIDLGILFMPGKIRGQDIINCITKNVFKPIILDRGMIAFPINNRDDLLDASNIIRIMEGHQNEKILRLEDIAIHRNLI